MKVIGINGSPRKNGNTVEMLDNALLGAKSMGAEMERINHQNMFKEHKRIYEHLIGPVLITTSVDTTQFNDYSKYSNSIFDPEKKAVRYRDVFPLECKKSFEMGATLMK